MMPKRLLVLLANDCSRNMPVEACTDRMTTPLDDVVNGGLSICTAGQTSSSVMGEEYEHRATDGPIYTQQSCSSSCRHGPGTQYSALSPACIGNLACLVYSSCLCGICCTLQSAAQKV